MYDCDYVRSSLCNKEFEPFFHPIVDASSGKCIGAEVLTRMVISEEIIPTANTYLKYITNDRDQSMLTGLMFKKIGAIIKKISLPKGFMLAFNLPVNLLREAWLLSACQDLIKNSECNLKLLLELTTQNELIIYDDQFSNAISHFNLKNIKLALDDYGTNHSNMALIQKIPFNYIKIPKEFVNPLPFNKLEGKIIENITHLARTINTDIIAKGVENDTQSKYLINRGIVLQQGFNFSAPIKAAELSDYLKKIIPHANPLNTNHLTSIVFQSSLLIQYVRKYNLSNREKEVLTMISEGLCVNTISERKCRSYKTIWSHKSNAYKKIGVKNDIEFFNLLHRLKS